MTDSRNTIIISIDVEPDIGSWTQETRGITEGMPRILDVLAKHSVDGTFFFTGREALGHPDMVARVMSSGHEIGCHSMFHETFGSSVYYLPGDSPLLESEMNGRLTLATDTVESVCGIRPVTFRAPRLFGSSTLLAMLENLGYIADSSYPAYFDHHSFAPYHPSREDWSKSGDMIILEVPPFYDADVMDEEESGRNRDQWPTLRLNGGDYFADLTLRMLDKYRDGSGRSVLTVYLHPWEFVEMHTEIVTTEARIAFMPLLTKHTGHYSVNALDDYLRAMSLHHVQFRTLRSVAEEWE